MSRLIVLCICFLGYLYQPLIAFANDKEAIARGKKALETRAFTPPHWSAEAYANAWKNWVPKRDKAPADYDKAFAAYYGLHAAPFKNGRYPMGLRPGSDGTGLTNDCMLCHGGSILGKNYVGLGNASLDLQAFFEDMDFATKGKREKLPYTVTNVRGTNEAFGMTEFLLSFRNPNLGVRQKPDAWPINDTQCEDVPAWWHLKKKKKMYHTASHNAASVRSIMQFMLDPRNPLKAIEMEEKTFRDIQAYLFSLEAPKYPYKVAAELAEEGRKLFVKNCATCHGTYGADATYPSRLVPLKEIGTDPTRVRGFSKKYVDFYNKTWFAKEKAEGFTATAPEGYQAPPLDGVWATAPYFHNGSAPTLYDVLNSKTRPKIFTRSYRTDEKDYDQTKVGWIVEVLPQAPKNLSPYEQRKIYDTTQPGRGNGGHTFGDKLNDDQRRAVIEYLKTL